MGQHQSRSEIIVGGRADSSFTSMVNEVTAFGRDVEGLSRKLFEYGKEALDTYRNYEDGILETRSVLFKQYNSGELNRVMGDLEKQAQKWAASTIFHTDDVANAMAEAAHAGWDYEKILEGIPSAMLIAQAGGLELTDSVDMLAKMLAATGTAFTDSEKFIDQWARSSDLVATDIGEMGEAFLRLGAAAQFTDSNEELFTMLAVLAQVGTTGSNAGTAVRNMMIRLIAPTEKAAAAMEELGISDDEVAEAFEGLDESSAAAYERLKEFGFDPYDEHGNLKGFIEIFTDLNSAIEALPDEQEQNKILAAIFPTRTLSYAKAMLGAVKDGSIYSIYDAIYGDSEGYAQGKSDIIMSGITGDLEILASKWEEVKRRIGENTSDDVSNWASKLSGFLDGVNNMDPILFNALVDGIETVAGVAGGLAATAAAIGIIGTIAAHPLGASLLFFAFGVSALTSALTALEEKNFEEQFGTMDLDTDALMEYVRTVTDNFNSAYTNVDAYNRALNEAVDNYQTASSALSGKLTTAMITGSQLTKEDVAELKDLGKSMGTELINGINASFDEHTEFRIALLGDDSFRSPTMQAAAIGMQRLKNELVAMAGTMGEDFGHAMDAAFEDGIITGEELNSLKAKIDEYNKAVAALQAIEDEAKFQYWERTLEDSQNVSFASYDDFLTQMNEEFDQTEAAARENYERERAWTAAHLKYMVDNDYEKDPVTHELWTMDDVDDALGQMDAAQEERMKNLKARRLETEERALAALVAGDERYGTYADMLHGYQRYGWGETEDEDTAAAAAAQKLFSEYLDNGNTEGAWIYFNEIAEGMKFLGEMYDHGGEHWSRDMQERVQDITNFWNAILGVSGEMIRNQEWENQQREQAEYQKQYDAIVDEYGGEPTTLYEDMWDAVAEPISEFFFNTLPSWASAEEYTEEELAAMQDEYSEKYGKSKDIWKAFGIVARLPKAENTPEAVEAAEDLSENAGLADTALADALMGVNFEGEAKFADALADFRQMMEAEEYAEEEMARTIHQYTSDELAATQAEYAGKYGKANGIWAMFGMPNPFARAGEGMETGSLLGLLTTGLFNYYTEGLNGKIPGTLGGTGAFASGLLAAILSGGGMLNAGGIGGIPYQGKLAQLMGKGNPYLNGLEYLISTGARGAFGLPAYNEGGYSTSSIVFGDAGEYAEEQMAEMQEAADAGIEVELLPTPDGTETAQVFIADAQAMLTSKPGKWTITPIMGGGIGGGRGAGGGGGLGTLFGASGGGLMYLPTELQYAEGGRATTASIFGEDGAEWAIPEEHSQRTAALLDAARKASGFGWGELLAMSGGLNAGGGGRSQIVYSPTIYANDARGVREALMEDKARMDKWWRDKERRDSLEVYA